jgi:hypothetical protein
VGEVRPGASVEDDAHNGNVDAGACEGRRRVVRPVDGVAVGDAAPMYWKLSWELPIVPAAGEGVAAESNGLVSSLLSGSGTCVCESPIAVVSDSPCWRKKMLTMPLASSDP